MEEQAFVWTSRIQTGVAIFALSLLYMAVIAPGEVAFSAVIGGGAALALYGITGSRLSFGVLAMLMLVTVACALFSALLEHGLSLVPVAVGQVVALFLMERQEARFWIHHEELPAESRV